MSTRLRSYVGCLALITAPGCGITQDLPSRTDAYSAQECASCDVWNTPQEPFRIYGNTFYVGTHGLSAVLITSAEGHILIDAGLPNSVPLILDNIRALGFDPADISLILNTHVHFDHAGGIAAIRQISGATVAANPASARVLTTGISGDDDPQYGVTLDFPAVPGVEQFAPGDTMHAGSLSVQSHPTPGHTPGGTSWSWTTCVADRCLQVVYADSLTPVSADGFRFSDNEAYPGAVDDFRKSFDALEQLSCDILVTTHPSASSLWERLADGPNGLVDAQACRRYSASARQQLLRRLDVEAADAGFPLSQE